ncbi:MAG: NADH-quinone oxidoreductase subunit N, partial [Oxalobacter sp.]|nr:NADH-quinone oxidoreductase subunit N [Oxalobacter sp.]
MATINLIPAIPELILTAALPVLMLVDLVVPKGRRDITFGLSILLIGVCSAGSFWLLGNGEAAVTFSGAFIADPVAHVLKLFTYFAMFMTLVYARRYVNERGLTVSYLGGAFYLLALFSLLGQMVTISAGDFLTLYLGIELMTFPLYALAALKREDGRSVEAATKYFILGALGTGLMLYGISMIYGVSGSFGFAEVAKALTAGSANDLIMVFGVVFVVCGIAFKLGAVPFHMWIPDVFEGVPTAVTLLVGGAPKLAGFAVCLRILGQALQPMA